MDTYKFLSWTLILNVTKAINIVNTFLGEATMLISCLHEDV